MAQLSAPIMFQRMRSIGVGGDTPPDIDIPVYKLTADATSVIEANSIQFTIARSAGSTTASSVVHWAAVTDGVTADDLDTPISGDVSFGSGELTKKVNVKTKSQAGNQGDRIITVTLTSVTNAIINSLFNTATATLRDFVATTLPKYQPTVAVSRQLCVGFNPTGCKATFPGTYDGLKQALQSTSWTPGDQVVIGDGTYSGDPITISRNGITSTDGGSHLMVCARNHTKAKVDCQLNFTGTYIWVTGIEASWNGPFAGTGDTIWKQRDQPFIIRNKGIWITNCLVSAEVFAHLVYSAGSLLSNLRLCYNTLNCDVNATRVGVIPIIEAFDFPNNAAAPLDTDIAYNFFRQMIKPNAPGTSDDRNKRAFFDLQPSKPSSFAAGATKSFRFHHNHMVGYVKNFSYNKRSCYFGYNYIKPLGGPVSEIGVIHRQGPFASMVATPTFGEAGAIEGNLFDCDNANMLVQVNGYSVDVSGNKAINGSVQLYLAMGNENASGSIPHDAADYCRVIENSGFTKVLIGDCPAAGIKNDDRGGFPDHVEIYKGSSGWTPAVELGADKNGATTPSSSYGGSLKTGYPSGYTAIVTITEDELLAACGCDAA